VLVGPTSTPSRAADSTGFELPEVDRSHPILFGADEAFRWEQGAYDVWVLRGRCYVQQGPRATESNQAVLWIKRSVQFAGEENLVIAYLDGDVRIINAESGGAFEMREKFWYGEFESTAPMQTRTPPPGGMPEVMPQVYTNAMAYRQSLLNPAIRRAQFAAPAAPPPTTLPGAGLPATGGPATYGMPGAAPSANPTAVPDTAGVGQPGAAPGAPPVAAAAAPSGRRLRAFSRTSVKVQVKWMQSPTNPQEWMGVITPGVNLIVDGMGPSGSLDISTDRMVVWTSGMDEPDLSGDRTQSGDRPLEFYMEGNIVFREGDRVIYADRMYYNVNRKAGVILSAEILSPVQTYEGLARLKAEVVRQIDSGHFVAEQAYVTTSRLGLPRYRLQSNQITLEDNTYNEVTADGTPVIDPETGEQSILHDRMVTSTNNFVYLGPVPVFYWPYMAADLENPQFYLRNIKIKSDRIFGQQVLTDWDIHQLLGLESKPQGRDWIGSVDYLSERGPALGTTYRYTGRDLFGFSGGHYGFADAWAINDDGLDNLGSDRSALVPDKNLRHRILGRHRQQLPNNFQFTGEVGWISDRNFLEQYYELEWDTFKDQSTGFELKQIMDNTSWSLSADLRLNKFFTETEQLPRLDHYWLGQPLLGDTLTWYEHSSAEYAKLQIVQTPSDPVDRATFAPLPWEVDSDGERILTRQELDLPLSLGPVKLVPYALGEAGHWGEIIDGGDTQRLYGQAGVRAALPFWSANPNIQSELFNVNGIAHKVTLDVDAYFADANRDLTEFPLYDNIDDNAQEHFRRRFAFNTFGGVTPARFDERFYALRSGLASSVTSPSGEIADDMAAVRMGLRQRWQTKRGPAANPRIVDWMLFDTEAVFFPDADRDNFGQDFGLLRYDYRWHVGERVTLLSDGGFDFFEDGQQTVSIGALLTRPTNGSLYFGYRSLEGPFKNQVLIAAANYRLSPKWFGSGGLSYDFSGAGTIGNSFSLVRIGESFLVSFNFSYDAYKNNISGTFNVEPRFIPGLARAALRGTTITPAGAYGLE